MYFHDMKLLRKHQTLLGTGLASVGICVGVYLMSKLDPELLTRFSRDLHVHMCGLTDWFLAFRL